MLNSRKRRQKLIDWYSQQHEAEHQASQNLNTDEALKLYSQTHPDYQLDEPKLSDYYRPSSNQKMGEMAYVGGGMLAFAYMVSKFF